MKNPSIRHFAAKLRELAAWFALRFINIFEIDAESMAKATQHCGAQLLLFHLRQAPARNQPDRDFLQAALHDLVLDDRAEFRQRLLAVIRKALLARGQD